MRAVDIIKASGIKAEEPDLSGDIFTAEALQQLCAPSADECPVSYEYDPTKPLAARLADYDGPPDGHVVVPGFTLDDYDVLSEVDFDSPTQARLTGFRVRRLTVTTWAVVQEQNSTLKPKPAAA